MIQPKTIQNLLSYMRDIKARSENGEIINVNNLAYEHGIGNSYFPHIMKLGYFTRLENGKYVCNVNRFEPHHARKVIQHYYSKYPKKHRQNNKNQPTMNMRRQNTLRRLRFTEDEKRSIIEEWLNSNCTKRAIWEKYTGQKEEKGNLLRWMRELGYSENVKPKNHPNEISKFKDDELFEELKNRGYIFNDVTKKVFI